MPESVRDQSCVRLGAAEVRVSFSVFETFPGLDLFVFTDFQGLPYQLTPVRHSARRAKQWEIDASYLSALLHTHVVGCDLTIQM